MLSFVYRDSYDITLGGIESLHAFDGRKFSRAWHRAREIDPRVDNLTIYPDSPAAESDMLLIHQESYLKLCRAGRYILEVLEVPVPGIAGDVLSPLLHRVILRPMRFAVAGTMLATDSALRGSLSINIGGGYHHASRDRGGGFCLYSDVPIAIASARSRGLISASDHVLIIDLDAHQGNGFQRALIEDQSVYFLDIFNEEIYPLDYDARARINYPVALLSGVTDDKYLGELGNILGPVIDEVQPAIAYYVAGTDVHEADRLGRMRLTEEGILRRDHAVLQALADKRIPTVTVTGGGYSKLSSKLIANMMIEACHLLANGGSDRG